MYDAINLPGIELFDNSFFKTFDLNSNSFDDILSSYSKAITLFVAARITEKFAVKNINIAIVRAMPWGTVNGVFDDNSQPITATTTIV